MVGVVFESIETRVTFQKRKDKLGDGCSGMCYNFSPAEELPVCSPRREPLRCEKDAAKSLQFQKKKGK